MLGNIKGALSSCSSNLPAGLLTSIPASNQPAYPVYVNNAHPQQQPGRKKSGPGRPRNAAASSAPVVPPTTSSTQATTVQHFSTGVGIAGVQPADPVLQSPPVE